MTDIECVLELIDSHKEFYSEQISNVIDLYKNKELASISEDYNECSNRKVDYGFNLFILISDKYYQENFHSDILKALLDPYEKHEEGYAFLYQFLDYIRLL